MDLKGIGWEAVEWIDLAQSSGHLPGCSDHDNELWITQKAESLLNS